MKIKKEIVKMNESVLLNEEYVKFLRNVLREKINHVINSGKLTCIDVSGFRGFGKTYILGEFAKKYDGIVLVPNKTIERHYNKVFGENIYACKVKDISRDKKIFIDEHYNLEELNQDIEKNVVVVLVNKQSKEDNFKDDIILKLKENAKILNKQIELKINSGDTGTVKNLIQALGNTLKLIDQYEYKLMFSKYKTTYNGKEIQEVAVWEQNGEGDIRNHQKFRVVDESFGKGFEEGFAMGSEFCVNSVLDEKIVKQIIEKLKRECNSQKNYAYS